MEDKGFNVLTRYQVFAALKLMYMTDHSHIKNIMDHMERNDIYGQIKNIKKDKKDKDKKDKDEKDKDKSNS